MQSAPGEWGDGTYSITPLVDWKPVPEARYEWWDGGRENLKGEFSGTGVQVNFESAAELVDVIIPRSVFKEKRSYELALGLRGRSAANDGLASNFARWVVYAGGAHRPSHPCISPASLYPASDLLPEEFFQYFLGYHFGLVRERNSAWSDLPGTKTTAPETTVTFDYFIRGHSRERTVALVPIANGKPVGPVEFQQVDNRFEFTVAYESSFDVEMPDVGRTDVYVAEWFDPFYPPQTPEGAWVVFPPDDYHFHAGERVMDSTPFGGTNVLRYEVGAPD